MIPSLILLGWGRIDDILVLELLYWYHYRYRPRKQWAQQAAGRHQGSPGKSQGEEDESLFDAAWPTGIYGNESRSALVRSREK